MAQRHPLPQPGNKGRDLRRPPVHPIVVRPGPRRPLVQGEPGGEKQALGDAIPRPQPQGHLQAGDGLEGGGIVQVHVPAPGEGRPPRPRIAPDGDLLDLAGGDPPAALMANPHGARLAVPGHHQLKRARRRVPVRGQGPAEPRHRPRRQHRPVPRRLTGSQPARRRLQAHPHRQLSGRRGMVADDQPNLHRHPHRQRPQLVGRQTGHEGPLQRQGQIRMNGRCRKARPLP